MAESTIKKIDKVTYEELNLGTYASSVWVAKMLQVVTIFIGNGAASPAGQVIGTLPEKYRPVMKVEFTDSYGHKRVRIEPSGEITAVEGGTIRGGMSFISAI